MMFKTKLAVPVEIRNDSLHEETDTLLQPFEKDRNGSIIEHSFDRVAAFKIHNPRYSEKGVFRLITLIATFGLPKHQTLARQSSRMSRIINTGDTAAKRRRAHRRSCAEVLRLLASGTSFDEQAQDMIAFMVFSLRGISKTIEESAQSWDDKNYWKKAEALRQKWRWAHLAANDLQNLVATGKWQLVPPALIELIPYFSDVHIEIMTRSPDWWVGARRSLLKELQGEEGVIS